MRLGTPHHSFLRSDHFPGVGVELSGGRAQVPGSRGWRSLDPSPSLRTSFNLGKTTTACSGFPGAMSFLLYTKSPQGGRLLKTKPGRKSVLQGLPFLAYHTPPLRKVNRSLLPAWGGGRRKYGGKSTLEWQKIILHWEAQRSEQCHKNGMLDPKPVGGTSLLTQSGHHTVCKACSFHLFTLDANFWSSGKNGWKNEYYYSNCPWFFPAL